MNAAVADLLLSMARNCSIYQPGRVFCTPDKRALAVFGDAGRPKNVSRAAKVAQEQGYLQAVENEWHMTQKARTWLSEELGKGFSARQNPAQWLQDLLFVPLPAPAKILRACAQVEMCHNIDAAEPLDMGQIWAVQATWGTKDRSARDRTRERIQAILDATIIVVFRERK